MKSLVSSQTQQSRPLLGAQRWLFGSRFLGLSSTALVAVIGACTPSDPDLSIGGGRGGETSGGSGAESNGGSVDTLGGTSGVAASSGMASSFGGVTMNGGVGGAGGGASAAKGGTAAGSAAGRGGTGNAGRSSAGGSSSTGGAATSTGGSKATPTAACGELKLNENVTVAQKSTDRFQWSDSDCQPRSAAMTRVGGGYVRQFTYQYDGKTRTASGTGANGHNGWGYAVSHELTGSIAQDGKGTFKPTFVGKHHALYEYRVNWPGAEEVVVILSWFFATGRNNPVVAITYDMSATQDGDYKADARTPYGDIAWDGDENWEDTVVSGVAWGDRYKFTTTKAPLTMDSPWDYSKPNVVPYVLEWADASDAEMGAVQTQTWAQHDAGGYWFYDNWGKTSANQVRTEDQAGAMPVTWNWPYQMNQYELCLDQTSCLKEVTNSHRLAWGANYGAVGTSEYPAYGDDKQLVGYPYQSYSVSMVLGKHSDTPVFAQVAEIETVQKTKLTATVGSIPTQGLAGIGRTDKAKLEPVGYDAIRSVWLADAASNAVTFKVVVASGSLSNPVLVLQNYTATSEPKVSQDGAALSAGTDYFASVDTASKAAYITFHNGWTGTQTFEVTP